MKKLLFVLPVFALQFASAQDNDTNFDNDDTYYGIVLKQGNDTYDETHINNVNPEAVRHIGRTYENAEDIRWVIGESGTTAQFNEGDKALLLTFDKSGDLLSTRITYSESFLDPFIVKYSKSIAGKTYSIYLVTEIIQKDQTIYEISLEDPFHWQIIRLTGNKIKGFEKSGDATVIEKS